MTTDLISFLITAHNAERTLTTTIAALQAQVVDQAFEIVIVDDRSSDRTHALAHDLSATDTRIRVLRTSSVRPDVTARQAALDLAVQTAKGSVLLLVDADAEPPTGWARRMVQALSHADLVASALVFEPATPRAWSWLALLQTADAAHYLGVCEVLGRLGLASGVCFGAAGFRRSLYDAIGGFGALGCTLVEDLAFARAAHRHGARVRVLWDAPVAVRAVPTLRDLLERVRRVSTTGGPSLLAAALGLWGASLLGLAVAALVGALPVTWFVVRYAVGVLWTLTQTARVGAWRAWFVAPWYEGMTILIALAVLCTPARSRRVAWGGLQYVRRRGSWTRVSSIPVR